MVGIRWFVTWLAAILSPVAAYSAVDAAVTETAPSAGLFDTLHAISGAVPSEALDTAPDWKLVPEGQLPGGFQGDVVLRNQRIAAVLRKGAAGVEVYSGSPKGWSRRALLAPCGAGRVDKLLVVKAVANDPESVAVEVSFQAGDGGVLGLVCHLRPGSLFLRTEPHAQTTGLTIEASSRFGMIPDFYADDIVLDAAKIAVPKVYIPSDNMLAQAMAGEALAVTLWDGPPQDAQIELAGAGDSRVIRGTTVRYARQGNKPGKVFFALLDAPGASYVDTLGGLPERTEPIAGFKLAAPVKRLNWRMPFPAQWRVDFATESMDTKLVRTREMSAPFPYPVEDGKCQGYRFIKPSYVWDWGGGKESEMSGTPDKYPAWVDFEGRGFVGPLAASYAVIVYPFDRGRGTPLEAFTLTDIVRETLGVGPCQYLLDADRRMAQTPGIFTCGGTDMLKKLEGRISEHQAEAEKHLSDMLVFVKAYRQRIAQYVAFKQELLAYLDAEERRHPAAREFAGRVRSLLGAIPSEMPQDSPKVIEQLNVEYRATLGSDDEVARKKRAELHPRYTAVGGAQDGFVERCHQAARLLRYEAGMSPQADPLVATMAVEVRKRASAVLQNPMYHETKDRFRP